MSGLSGTLKRATSASASRDPASMLIVANRKDGLGGRLLAMANAKGLADRLGYRFGFTWSDTKIIDEGSHTVDVVGKIFDAAFIEKHWLGEKIKKAHFGFVGDRDFTPAGMRAAEKQRRLRGWICDEFHALDFFHDDNAEPVARSEALRAFGFSPAVREAMDAAGRCRFPGPMAALHLRSGDIIYGQNRRRMVFTEKAIPSALAKAIIAELSSRGLTTLLIGQDDAALDYLKAETGAMRTSDFGVGQFTEEVLDAFFEMALMARCQQIHASGSIYAVVASLMGGKPCIGTSGLFSHSRAVEIITDELRERPSDYHRLDAAFGYRWAFRSMEDEISPARARELLAKAQALDPENDAYDLKIAAAYFHEGDHAAGEAILKSLMTSQWPQGTRMPLPMMDMLTTKHGGYRAMARDFDGFLAAARAGHPYAMACSAYILVEALDDRASGMEMMARLVRMEPANPIFRKIRRRVSMGKKPEAGRLAKARWRLGLIRPPWF